MPVKTLRLLYSELTNVLFNIMTIYYANCSVDKRVEKNCNSTNSPSKIFCCLLVLGGTFSLK